MKLFDIMFRLRLRMRYYASSILLVAGIVYSVLGFVLFIPSFLAPPVSLLALIPAVFLSCMGMALWKYRTETNFGALLWWELPAFLFFVCDIIMLCCGLPLETEKELAVLQLIGLVAFAGPGLFAIAHGNSLFGPTALTHNQIKELYKKTFARQTEEPNRPPIVGKPIEDGELLPLGIKFGSVVLGCALVVLNAILILETFEKLNAVPVTNGDSFVASGSSCAMLCRHVADGQELPTLLSRTQPVCAEDSGWQCLCAKEHSASDVLLVSVDHVVQFCPPLKIVKNEAFPCSYSIDFSSKTFKRQKR